MKTATCVMVSKFESDSYSTSYHSVAGGPLVQSLGIRAWQRLQRNLRHSLLSIHLKKDPSYTICKSLTFLVDPVLNARFSAKNPRNKKNIRV